MLHVFEFVREYKDMISRIIDPKSISKPKNGKLDNDAVMPNNPSKAGNKPTKQLGHAPPKRPPKIPMKPKLPAFFKFFKSLTLR